MSTATSDKTERKPATCPRIMIGFRPNRSHRRAMLGLVKKTQTAPRTVKLEPIRSAFLRASLQAADACPSSMHGLVPPLKNAVEKAGKTRALMTVEAVPHTTTSQKAGQPLEHRPLDTPLPIGRSGCSGSPLVIGSVIDDADDIFRLQ